MKFLVDDLTASRLVVLAIEAITQTSFWQTTPEHFPFALDDLTQQESQRDHLRGALLCLCELGYLEIVRPDVFTFNARTAFLSQAMTGLADPSGTAQTFFVRHPTLDDIAQLLELDRLTQPSGLHTPVEELIRRVTTTPQTTLLLDVSGCIGAALYSQRIDAIEALRGTDYADCKRLQRNDGQHVQLLGLYVLPSMRGRGYSDVLIESMLLYARLLGSVKSVVGVTRCADYPKHRLEFGMHTYIRAQNTLGQLLDPMLHFHVSHGARVREVLPGFRAGDVDNEGAGVLIQYELELPLRTQALDEVRCASKPQVQSREQIERTVHDLLLQVLGPQRFEAYAAHIPLMEMGLTSLELLELRRLLSAASGLELDATFFFYCNTPDAVVAYWAERLVTPTVTSETSAPVTSTVPIAIIGMACRLPGGLNNPQQFWEALLEGRDVIGPMPEARRALRRGGDGDFRWQAGFLEDIDRFDAGFFRISPKEAEWLDPQQRLLMETSWAALEDAGIAPNSLRGGKHGVFIGLMGSDYAALLGQGESEGIEAQFATGSACSVAAGRLAYFLDWQGPALTVDTACSSSLVAVHLACRSLQTGECGMALAGGASVLLDDNRFEAFDRAAMLSPTGRCHSFDERGDGYVRAEGCAALVLKRLVDAQADGDPIVAVIRGSAINQDGSSASLTAPNPKAQQAVIEAALASANVDAPSIAYLEAHGTGTPLGDPIEVQAAMQVLGLNRSQDRPLLIGSVKSSVGHLEAVAGIAGLIKTVLCLQHERIPGQVLFDRPNPHIPWETLAVQVVNQTRVWPQGNKRAGVSSFGFSGTNAHVIVEAYSQQPVADIATDLPCAIILSARTDAQLVSRAQQLSLVLEQQDVELNALAYTLQTGRDAMAVRLAFMARSVVEVRTLLKGWLGAGRLSQGIFKGVASGAGKTAAPLVADEGPFSESLLEGWVNGGQVDWHRFYGAVKPRRLNLPTYPFADERFWLPFMRTPAVALAPVVERSLLLTPTWERTNEGTEVGTSQDLWLSADPSSIEFAQRPSAIPFVAADTSAVLVERLQATRGWDHLVWLVPSEEPGAAVMGFRLIQALLTLGYAHQALNLTVVTRQAQAIVAHEPIDAYHASVLGLMGSLAKEYPHWQVGVLDRPVECDVPLHTWIRRSANPQGNVLVWRKEGWFRQRLVPCEAGAAPVPVYREGGVYVVVGGAGGLGVVLSDYLIRRYGAQMVWLGRRAEDELITQQRTRLAALGPMPLYLQADANDPQALRRAHEVIREHFGAVHGVVHSVMELADSPLAQMDEATFVVGLKAKMTAHNLDALVGGQPVDFVLFFSSINSFLKTANASNYSAGCCFADACAHNFQRRGYPVKVMHWGHWGDTGGGCSPAYRAFMAQIGMTSIPPGEAMALLEQLLAGPLAHLLFAKTSKDIVARMLGITSAPSVTPIQGAALGEIDPPIDLEQSVIEDLTDQACRLLKLPAHGIDPSLNLNTYGFDSILLMEYARQLSDRYGLTLSPSLFFSHTNLLQFAAYLLQFFTPAMISFYAPDVSPEHPPSASQSVRADAAAPVRQASDEEIAIIGMSGRFADARSVDQLWDILRGARSAVKDFPHTRVSTADALHPRWLAAVPGLEEFDPLFFEISPHDAALIDPRQRLLLQEAWRALEDAAYGEPQLLKHTISLFVGVEAGDYGRLIAERNTLTANHEAILASRLAYVLNLSGGAIAINTACSSSLVALHQACQSLRARECDTALVAGVNLLLSTQLYDQMAEAGMLAAQGVCYAFDQRATGMVPGEAAVAVVLKRLSDALADGDPIRAVIAGSGINYDGKTQGITAPSGKAQTKLLQTVYERYHVNPDQLEYVVTHGTGTPLGDPVEVNALCDAFAPFTQRQQFCALTSNKPNVGHSLAASGLVSVVNLVQALEHETIPPSVHAEQQSTYVNWASSPFFVNTAARPWPQRSGAARLGAVSAFGMSGTNAHVVIRGAEALPAAIDSPTFAYALMVLSAKTEAALRLQLQALIGALQAREWSQAELQKMSHTLQSGRHHFAWRCAVVIKDKDHAASQLQRCLDAGQDTAIGYGQVARGFTVDKARLEQAHALLAHTALGYDPEALRATLETLGQRYREGYDLAWGLLFGDHLPTRIHLPTYPFERERFWAIAPSTPQVLHPLVHRDTRTADRQRYTTRLTGEETVLRDHRVSGARILPGVAHLEWARAAVHLWLGNDLPVRLEQVAWLVPLIVDAELQVHIELVQEGQGRIAFHIYRGEGANVVRYSQGWVQQIDAPNRAAPRVDLASVGEHSLAQLSGEDCYARFAAAGLELGPAFQVIRQVKLAETVALGELQAVTGFEPGAGWVLPPGMLDGALQVGAQLSSQTTLALPFAVHSVEQWGAMPETARVVARRISDGEKLTPSFDIDIVNADGSVALRMCGFSARVRVTPQPAEADELTLTPVWLPVPAHVVSPAHETGQVVRLMADPEFIEGQVSVQWRAADSSETLLEHLTGLSTFTRLLWHVPQGEVHLARMGLRLIKALLASGFADKPLELTVVTRQAQGLSANEKIDPEQAALHGLIGSLAKQYVHWRIRLLDLPEAHSLPEDVLLAQPVNTYGNARLWREGCWYQQQLARCVLAPVTTRVYRDSGVYVVVGGAGGLGVVLSEHLIRQCRAQMVWLGRREEDDAITQARGRLGELGPTPLYLQVDATDRDALALAQIEIVQRFGPPNGVIHSAMVLADKGLASMDEVTFEAAVSAKALTAQRVDEVFGHHTLDFVLFFGSLQSFLKAQGQSNYAAGCCYSDALAGVLGQQRPYPVKVMHWGYWGTVGVVATPTYQNRLAQMGLGSIEPGPAMAVLDQFVASPVAQAVFLKTSQTELPAALGVYLQMVVEVAPWLPSVEMPIDQPPPSPPAGIEPAQRIFEQQLAPVFRQRLLAIESQSVSHKHRPWYEASLRRIHSSSALDEPGAAPGVQWSAYVESHKDDAQTGAQVRLANDVLQRLPEILRDEVKATQVVFSQGQVQQVEAVYGKHPVANYFNTLLGDRLQAYIEQRLARDPQARLRILEVGAGSGGTTTILIARLGPYAAHIDQYCYTDLAGVFLGHGHAQFGASVAYLHTQLLDIERSPMAQGFRQGDYDVVVATNVLHATRDIRNTLRNTKALLKGNGLLLLNELSGVSLFQHLVFGVLDGWWLAQDRDRRIADTPALSAAAWREALTEAGFNSIGITQPASCELGQHIIEGFSDAILCFEGEAQDPQPVTRDVESAAPVRVTAAAVGAHASLRQTLRACLLETLGLKEAQLQDDQAFISYGVDSISSVALVNTLNSRLGLRLPATVLYDYPTLARLCAHLQEIAVPETAVLQPEITDSAMSEPPVPPVTRAPVKALFVSAQPLSAAQTYRRVLLERPGSIDQIRVVDEPLAALGPNDVRIAVQAFSLNFGDLLCVSGLYPTQPEYPFTPGYEASGIVTAVGAEVVRATPGDRVVALADHALGAHATVMTCSQEQVFPCPAGLSFEAACAMPSAALTVIECFARAQLKAGERILIQTATGGVGLMAVQLAQHIGAQVFATAGSRKKLDYLATLGVRHLINYPQEDFADAIHRMTQGQGVDVVLNTLDGDAMQKGLRCLSAGGRYIEIAMTALKSARAIDLSLLDNNQSVHCIDMRKLGLERPERLRNNFQTMVELLEQGAIAATLSKTFPFDDVHSAYRWLQSRDHIGKGVVSIPPALQFQESAGVPAASNDLEPIAIIGMSGRFASAPTTEALWDALVNGVDLVEEVSRWELSSLSSESAGSSCKQGGFLSDIECFDPLFFNISSMEAAAMDPQQRLLLEETWHALEDAGHAGRAIEGARCGVYVGCSAGDYLDLLGEAAPAQAFWGNAASVIPARIAFHLNWQGPAVATDTACSSSLVAIHQACQALRDDEVDMALAGGVFVQCTQRLFRQANQAGMLSNTGRCSVFDEQADGFVPGESVAAIVLKRLSHAQADGDTVYGVIRGSGINYDGATNGITAPSGPAQTRLVREVYERFAIDCAAIQLVEAHGTGTVLGDPIEFNALADAYGTALPRAKCAIASIKSNLGHAATAAGVVGVIKVLLAMEYRQIPPSLHFHQGNRHIDFAHSPFYVPTQAVAWEVPQGSERMAAVSSFGFSGTNAHAVIAQAPSRTEPVSNRPFFLIVLSARTPEQLRQLAQHLAHQISRQPVDMGAMSYTLLMGRRHHDVRLACVAADIAQVCEQLNQWLDEQQSREVISGHASSYVLQAQSAVRQLLETCQNASSPQGLKEALSGLASLYVQGAELPWERIFDRASRRRIRLPTYPFARERYWPLPTTAQTPAVNRVSPSMPAASNEASASVRQALRGIFKRVLALRDEQLRDDVDIACYGIDSIIRMELVRALNQHFELSLSNAVLDEYPSVKRLSLYIEAAEQPVDIPRSAAAEPERDVAHIEPANDRVYLAGTSALKADVESVWKHLFVRNTQD
ncbi:SDR family NAD(P)-dependent oxidoreductase [Pseudomonas sp. TMW22091]|uniref:SDR family NAD(P)-dependent oxidoreductase n=1 Tax=Pseudomonas sp. TMW22091 TaxID=2506435 RepID=UPI001F0DE931|nr:SDR family NAD(P)-dependent oxidoreductase [Pseudomonas sp. TMW22091]MCH4875290.1 KR domain-containing protein [Pseudomonas sp. TMW22091]